jgi:hypothetical protein
MNEEAAPCPQIASQYNRAPVLTLWEAIVAERLGFDRDEALSLAKAVAGLNAAAKGRRLGIFKPSEQKPTAARKKARDEGFLVELCGRPVPTVNTDDGIRATRSGKAIDPGGVESYLERSFGEHLDAVRSAMVKLAKSYKPAELAGAAVRRSRALVRGHRIRDSPGGLTDRRIQYSNL